MKRSLLVFFFSLVTLSVMATGIPGTQQVLIVSGGKFGDPNNYVRVGYYNPKTGVYTVFDSIHAASTKSVIVSENSLTGDAYVTADTVILRYDLTNHTREAISPSVKGITYLAEYDTTLNPGSGYILATRGFGADSDYVYVFKADDLSLAHIIKGISGQAAGIVVMGDTAYVAVPGAFGNPTGSIAVIDLKNMVLDREISLDTLGAGIDKLIGNGLWETGNSINTINSKYNILITLNTATGAITTTQLSKDAGRIYGRDDDYLYLETGNTSIAEYSLSGQAFTSDSIVKYSNIPGVTAPWDIASVAVDKWSLSPKQVYISVTDFFSYGKVFVFSKSGGIIDTIETGISPEAVAFYREIVGGVKETRSSGLQVRLYPNPASSQISCELPEISSGSYQILSTTGQVIQRGEFSKTQLLKADIQSLNKGMYILQLNTAKGIGTSRFVRE